MKKAITGRVIRAIDDTDEKAKKTYVAVGNRAGEPVHAGAVALGGGMPTISDAFAAFEMAGDDGASFAVGKDVTITIED